ncbi:lytic transglycosylase domain-containing protein [Haloglycomyces albus]|uniref:aggregation-promoting factor C-terminal-like domain-containing protein n=1 Tax=Haloglycomyces albus TaxID=526067 RepID=UPI00046CBE6D|nr:lytic transglycosylase domain-containing protein [Haloglycomyces albus]
MIPLLTKYGARLAAVAVLILAAFVVVQLNDTDLNDIEQADPRQAALDQERRAEEAYAELQVGHADYIPATAGADADTKAAALATYAADKSESLETYQSEAEEQQAIEEANTNPVNVPIPGSCDEFSGNRATGCAITLEHGFDLEEFACLEALWSRESGWNETAANPASNAYGIPQANPGSKMSSEGSDWETNPVTQIEWGLGYIEGKYASPCGAWQQSEAAGWYLFCGEVTAQLAPGTPYFRCGGFSRPEGRDESSSRKSAAPGTT